VFAWRTVSVRNRTVWIYCPKYLPEIFRAAYKKTTNQPNADILTIPFRHPLWYSMESAPKLMDSNREVSCQTTNYQIYVKYCRYFLDTCTLPYLGIGCQIELIMNGDLKMKMGKSWFPESSFRVGISFGYIDHIVSENRVSNWNPENWRTENENG